MLKRGLEYYQVLSSIIIEKVLLFRFVSSVPLWELQEYIIDNNSLSEVYSHIPFTSANNRIMIVFSLGILHGVLKVIVNEMSMVIKKTR